MNLLKLRSLLLSFLLLGTLVSCHESKEEVDPEVIPTVERKGMYILSEGLFNANNSSLTYYDFETQTLVDDQFEEQNGRGLGDTANDIEVYGSKMYIVVNVSSTVEVVDAKTAKSIKQIDLKDNGVGRQPRFIEFYKNKAYISSFDGTIAVMDTATLEIEKFVKVGKNPEQLAIINDKIYVANSGGLDYPNYDNTVSVIDINTFTEIKKIEVEINPRIVAKDQYGNVYVMSSGDYGIIKPSLAVIDSKTDVLKSQELFEGASITIQGDLAYIPVFGKDIKVYNIKTRQVERDNFITDGTVIKTAYGVAVDPITEDVFVTDAKNYVTKGDVTCFDKNGVKKYSIPAGINPNSVVFINK
jgi:YVTN family beta-propeller protein